MQEEMAQVREQLLGAPASVVLANHAMGMYELAAIHLTATEPKLTEAVLAIDALNALVTSLEGRLGEAEPTLREALGQLRAAYPEVKGRTEGGPSGAATSHQRRDRPVGRAGEGHDAATRTGAIGGRPRTTST